MSGTPDTRQRPPFTDGRVCNLRPPLTDGVAGLEERSRAPLSHPHAVADDVVEKILRARKKHPRWGPRKLRVILQRHYPQLALPATSTIGEVLRKNGLIQKRRRIRRSSPYGDRLGDYGSPNAVWCADFKGHFPVAGERCHPLTVSAFEHSNGHSIGSGRNTTKSVRMRHLVRRFLHLAISRRAAPTLVSSRNSNARSTSTSPRPIPTECSLLSPSSGT